MVVQKYTPVTHVIFDLDGLLLNTETRYDEAAEIVCGKYGKEYTLEARTVGYGATEPKFAETVVNLCKLPISVQQFLSEIEEAYEEVFARYIDFMPGADKLVKHLHAHNVPIAIGTNCQNSGFKLKAKHHAEFFNRFNHIVLGPDDPDVKLGKPAPDVFLVAAKRFDPPPVNMKNVLVFEDSLNGVTAGLAAGMQVVWVPPPILDTSASGVSLVLSTLELFEPQLFGLPSYQ